MEEIPKSQLLLSLLFKGLRAVAIAYILALVIVFFFQERILFFPTHLKENDSYSFKSKFIENYLTLHTGDRVNYLVFSVEHPKGVILYFHGNAGALDGWGDVASELTARTQHEVWIMDYPGFGKSGTTLPKSDKILIKMGIAFVSKIRETHPDLPIILYGRSIDSGLASAIAMADPKIKALILETPYLSLKALAREFYSWIPTVLLRFNFDNTRLTETTALPILIVQGTADEVIPYHHGKDLAEILNQKAKFVSITGGHHNDLSRSKEYWSAVEEFVAQ